MSRLVNYLGQVRVYSFIDLVLLLYVAGAQWSVLIGAILLWLGFLAYLETQHAHVYRAKIPTGVWHVLLLGGLILYGRIEGVLFVLSSYFYTKKKRGLYGFGSPLVRGSQNFFLVAGIVGYDHFLPWLALTLTVVRNALGDWRDVEKDIKEDMRTLPIALGYTQSVPGVHLLFLLCTTFAWWNLSALSVTSLIAIWIVQILTYNLTPR